MKVSGFGPSSTDRRAHVPAGEHGDGTHRDDGYSLSARRITRVARRRRSSRTNADHNESEWTNRCLALIGADETLAGMELKKARLSRGEQQLPEIATDTPAERPDRQYRRASDSGWSETDQPEQNDQYSVPRRPTRVGVQLRERMRRDQIQSRTSNR